MKDKVQMGLAIAAGYYLGRHHKLRWATTLAVAGVLSRLRGQGGLLSQGIKMLGSSPEMDKLTGRLRGELMDVGKAAAVAMTSRQLESLTTRLHERAEGLRHPGTPEETAEDEEDYEEGYEEEEEEEAPEEEPPKPARRRKPKAEPARATRPVTRTRRRA
ncbi:hypothetical protein AB0H88_39860 [Nonomuraea sp. NPDC050680]|uniref:hypothetical protein n=1 Tax=Nonomuraea sp. NPDC050680 TaxID=3154630 RepID=UPI00340A24A7